MFRPMAKDPQITHWLIVLSDSQSSKKFCMLSGEFGRIHWKSTKIRTARRVNPRGQELLLFSQRLRPPSVRVRTVEVAISHLLRRRGAEDAFRPEHHQQIGRAHV